MMLASPARFVAVDARVSLPEDPSDLDAGATLRAIAVGCDGDEYQGAVRVQLTDSVLSVSRIFFAAQAWLDGAVVAVLGVIEAEAWARLVPVVRIDLGTAAAADRQRHILLLGRWGYRQVSDGVLERAFSSSVDVSA
ncbi:MAG: hypothetical protein JNK82_31655 [Myxococcaceae bacterium]|nr:hypothetical protein [Myxococcaceae bacterium]